MKTKNVAAAVQKHLTHRLPGQLQRPRSIPAGDCWPQSDGRQKTSMWQSPGWPTPGKNIPRDAQSLLSRLKNS